MSRAIGRFPLANLVGQMIKQISKPFSKRIVRRMQKHPYIREYFLARLGRLYHWCEAKVRKLDGISDENREIVDDVRSMELGTQMLIEVVLFASLAAGVYYEAHRSTVRSKRTEAVRKEQMNEVVKRKDLLLERVGEQKMMVEDLKQQIIEYAASIGCKLPDIPEEEVPDTKKQ